MNKIKGGEKNYRTRNFFHSGGEPRTRCSIRSVPAGVPGILKEPHSSGKRKIKTGKKSPSRQEGQSKTDPVLIKAYKIISAYAKATGAFVCVQDHNYMPIQEIYKDIVNEKNTCLYCMKHKARTELNKIQDLKCIPCSEMHINAIKEAHRFGGSYIYICEMGFLFWTSPVYARGRFIGALVASGFLGVDREEASAQMYRMGNGSGAIEELNKRLAAFPRGDSEKIKSLAELLLICAESLSTGGGNYYETLRRRAEQQSELSAIIEELKNKYPSNGPVPGYPLDKERLLLSALRRGDTKSGRRILNEILAILLFSNPDEFKLIQFRAIELVVLFFRSDNALYNQKALSETSNYYLRRIQGAKSIEELTDTLHIVVDRMAARIFSFQGIRHASALKKAEQYINKNYTRKISLKEIAEASGLSAPYFSTIFKEEMGENLSRYLNRLRVERAGRLLVQTDSSLSKIAGLCGFEDQSWFSKIFKSFTGISPGEFRSRGGSPIEEITEDNFSETYLTVIKEE